MPTSPSPAPASPNEALRWAAFGVGVSVIGFFAKVAIAVHTGSTAVLSDAMESSVNLVTSGFTVWAVWLSTRPRDEEHPYGHGKVEYFSVAIEAVLLGVAGIAIALVAGRALFVPPDLRSPGVGALAALAVGMSLWASGAAMIRAGRRLESPAIVADGEHLRADAVTTAAIVVGLALVAWTGVRWLDPALGLILAAWVLRSAWRLMREAIGGLMDEASEPLLDAIADTLESVRRPGWTTPHHVKVHRLGSAIHVDLHIVFPWYSDLRSVHEDSLVIEAAMRERFGARCETMVHMEPCRPSSCRLCDLEACPERGDPFEARVRWTGAQIRQPRRHGHVEATHRTPLKADVDGA
jgi:cation diffusion facilitator family transporter